MNRALRQARDLAKFLKSIGVQPWHFALPVVFSLAAAALEGLSLGLLIPLLQGVLTLDFSFVGTVAGLRDIVPRLPRLAQQTDVSTFIWLIAIIFAAALAKNFLKYLSAVSAAYISRIATHNLRRLIFGRYLSFGKLFFDQQSLGYLNQVLMVYSERVAHPIQQGYQVINTAFSLLVYLALMFAISWRLTLLVFVLIPIMNYSLKAVIMKIRHASRGLAESANDFSKQAFNILSSIPLVKAYTNEAAEEKRFAQLSDRVASIEFSMNRGKQMIAPAQESITIVAVLLVVIIMAYLTVRGGGTATASLLVYFYIVMNAANTYGGVNRFWGVLAEVTGPLQEVRQMLSNEGKFFVPDGARTFVGPKEAIEFKNLTFSYPNGRKVLHNVSFSMKAGAMTALVGPTGAGKSTIINLLMRLYDSEPAVILIDGVDIRDFSLASLRARMALVSQDTQLFNDTLAHNITYGLEGISDGKLAAAVRAARLEDFVAKLPQGLATEIGDRGVQLSGGEKQRVSIARALLKDAEILILDEATSALDSQTERLVQEAIDEAVSGRTSVVIAHRLSTIRHADHIIVLDEGRVVEEGSLPELLKRQEVFSGLWEAQKFY